MDQPLEQGRCLRPGLVAAGAGVAREDGVDLVPGLTIDDGLVLARVGLVLVDRLADVDPVLQGLVDPALGEGPAATIVAIGRGPALGGVAIGIELLGNPCAPSAPIGQIELIA